jgi:hypothetical protein
VSGFVGFKRRKFRQDLQDRQDNLFPLFLKKSEKLKPSPLVDCAFSASSGSCEIKKIRVILSILSDKKEFIKI